MRQHDAKSADAGLATDWYDSVAFCRWLGQQSDLPEWDQPYADPETLDKAKYPREPNPAASWAPRNWPLELGRRGFRLPTESEWEVASRERARTPYGFGSDASLLGQFGWFAVNSGTHVHPPRELRPSIRGLFDLHGNLFEWCHDWFEDYSVEPVTDPLGAKEETHRMTSGGSWFIAAAYCRSACRNTGEPTRRAGDTGFRLALSLPRVTPEVAPVKGEGPSGSHEASICGTATGDAFAGCQARQKDALNNPGSCCSSGMRYSVRACLRGFPRTPAIHVREPRERHVGLNDVLPRRGSNMVGTARHPTVLHGVHSPGYTMSPRAEARTPWGTIGHSAAAPGVDTPGYTMSPLAGLEIGGGIRASRDPALTRRAI